MEEALRLARIAASLDEVPIGAVLVVGDEIIARSKNERESARSATRHAEIIAIEEGCRTLGGWRLPDCTLYVTMEPCAMCAGAIVNGGATVTAEVDAIGGIRNESEKSLQGE